MILDMRGKTVFLFVSFKQNKSLIMCRVRCPHFQEELEQNSLGVKVFHSSSMIALLFSIPKVSLETYLLLFILTILQIKHRKFSNMPNIYLHSFWRFLTSVIISNGILKVSLSPSFIFIPVKNSLKFCWT